MNVTMKRLLVLNLFLQAFDGTVSYFILSSGVLELNPFVGAAIEAWGLVWALVYWKGLVCGLLLILYSLGYFRATLPLRSLTFTAIVYASLAVYLVFNLLESVS